MTTRKNNPAVEDLGRKARARLQEERDKRPEIVRLTEPVPAATISKKRKARQSPVLLSLSAAAAAKKPKKRITKPRKRRIAATAAVQDKNVDRWMPSTAALPAATTKESKSRFVQVHGIPVGTTPLQIRRFFSGLHPQHVYILPTDPNPQRRLTHLLDASTTDPPRKRGGVARYEQLRVLVQFDAAPTAALAADRSGEVLQLSDDNTTMKGAAIAVTHMVKSIAASLLMVPHSMAVEATQGVPLDEGLKQIEDQLDPRVLTILWKEVEEKLSPNKKSTKRIPYKPADYERLVEYQRTLLENYEQLAVVESRDLTLVDPIIKLTAGAASCIQMELQRVDQRLLQARRWKSLFGTVSKAVAELEV